MLGANQVYATRYGAETPITGHLRGYVPTLDKHKAVQMFPQSEGRNNEDNFF